jgi:energy-coupling factor transporter ATP-binding protein EcfA2
MSTATTTDTRSAALPAADRHDLIRVHGARVNNLKDVSVELPKRRLTVFTGVSGSGKSSLVFDTIAAESQRLINETYSAFVQGFMPTAGAARGRRPRRADHRDHRRPGADGRRPPLHGRHRHGRGRDAAHPLQPARAAAHRLAQGVLLQRRLDQRGGRGHARARRQEREGAAQLHHHRRHVPALRGPRLGQRHRPHAALRRGKVAQRGALTIPGYTMEGWYGRIFRGCGFFDPDKPIRKYTKRELDDLLHKEPTKIKVDGINLTYAGLIPSIQKSFLSKDVDGMQPHIRAFVERAVTFTTCPECDGTRLNEGARSSRIDGRNIADVSAMQISDLAAWVSGLDEPSVAPLLGALRHTLDSFVEIGLGYLSLDRPAGTLSGGEAQRVKMIRHLGSSLTDVTYVFDEPTIGLHPHDIERMNQLLLQLRDKGNTVLVVEHKPEAIAIADHVVDSVPEPAREAARWSSRARGGPARERHGHGPAPRRPGRAQGDGP